MKSTEKLSQLMQSEIILKKSILIKKFTLENMSSEITALKKKVAILERDSMKTKKELRRGLADLKDEVKKLFSERKTTETVSLKNIEENQHMSEQNETVTGLNIVKDDLQKLKTETKLIWKRIETPADKIKSFKDLRKEFRAFFSINGYSEALETSNLFKKAFWLACMVTLFVSGMILVDRNLKDYQTFDVVTQNKILLYADLKFPAITFCLFNSDFSKSPQNLRNAITWCSFNDHTCTIDDFEYIPVYSIRLDVYHDCYKFNGARNGSNHTREISSVAYSGIDSGLWINLNLSKSHILAYLIDENYIEPRYFYLNNFIQSDQESGKRIYVSFKKTVDIKIPEPYSPCRENINSETSYLVKQFLEQNSTYRSGICYEKCYNEYLTGYALSRNISKKEAYDSLVIDLNGNCSHLCPLECNIIYYEISKNEVRANDDLLHLNFFFADDVYTEISQTIKTTSADMISNIGGVLGLFLELSFISAYRFISFLFDGI